jgi:hypothetical protein
MRKGGRGLLLGADAGSAGASPSRGMIRKDGRQSRAVGPRVLRRAPGPTAQPLLRPCLKSRSFQSIPPGPPSGASASSSAVCSGSSHERTARSGGSVSRPGRAACVGKLAGSNLSDVGGATSALPDKTFGSAVSNVDIGHLPARRGKNQGGAPCRCPGRESNRTCRRRPPATRHHSRRVAHAIHLIACRASSSPPQIQTYPLVVGPIEFPGRHPMTLNYQFTSVSSWRPVSVPRFATEVFVVKRQRFRPESPRFSP